jgi:nicotinamidase-related amidase
MQHHRNLQIPDRLAEFCDPDRLALLVYDMQVGVVGLSLSAFEGTPLEFALRDAQVTAFAIVGVAMEVGIEPTVRHGADLGLIPVLVTDACGAGNPAAAKRLRDALATAGDAILTDISTITGLLETARAPEEIPR